MWILSKLFVFALLAVPLLSSCFLTAQSLGGAGTIQGQVLDPSNALVPNATVEIKNPVTGYTRTVITDNTGSFTFTNIPRNAYHLSVTAQGFQSAQKDVDVRSSVPIQLNFNLEVAASGTTIEVHGGGGDLLETDTSAHTDVDANQISRIPMQSGASELSQVLTLATPGVTADANGFFHPLGDHAQATFAIDGQTVSDQQSRTYSNQLPMNAVQSFEAISGVAPAEYGDKTSLVTVLTTKSGLGQKPNGSVSFDYGSFANANTTISLGLGNTKVGNFLSVGGLNSDRYIDSPEFTVLHDKGNSETVFDRLDYAPTAKDTLHLNLFAAHSWFQAPNTFDQQALNQDQRQKMVSFNIAPGWTHLFSPTTLLTVNTFLRQDRVSYYPSSNLFADQPQTVGETRRLTNGGVRADLSYVKGHHNFKAGTQVMRTALSEHFKFGVTDPANNPVCLDANGNPITDPTVNNPACTGPGQQPNPAFLPGLLPFDLSRGGALLDFQAAANIDQQAFYVQDALTFGSLTVNPGLRVDHYDGLTANWAAQPRIGASYRIARTNTVLRGAYGRTLETPYNENLLVASSSQLGNNVFNSTVNTPPPAGHRNQFNAGLQQAFGKFVMVDADFFWKYTDNAFDFNVLGTTPLAFPIAWRKSKLNGYSIRVSMPEFHGFRAFTVMGHANARFFNPAVGGLFFADNPTSGVFRIDHDQNFDQTTNLQYTFNKKSGAWGGFTWRYDSGLVAGSVPDFATALTLTPDQQAAIGLFCGGTVATLTSPITSCSDPNRGALRVHIPAEGTENDDKNPARIAPRHLFDLGLGVDNIFRSDKHRWSARFSVVNLTNQIALYNFLSTFSGTHFVTPRSYQGGITYSF
jgi:hypothetical protein